MDWDKISEQYYTAKDARAVLGLNENTFQTWVKTGKIKRIKLPGRGQGMYEKRDIDALALAMHMMLELKERLVFSKSTPGDQVEEMDIGIRNFGSELITPLPERIAFQQKNEFTFWSLKIEGRVVGYASLFRFLPQFLDALLTGRHIERDITVKEVLPFTRLEAFNLYIDVMAIDPQLPHHLRHLYAGVIVSRLADVLLDLRANGYLIEALYTVTATQEGDNLVKKLGFHLMSGKSLAPGRVAYEFRLDEQGLKHLKSFSRRGV
jgi:hypothetical protein